VCTSSGNLRELTEFGIFDFDFDTDVTSNCDRTAANASYSFHATKFGACRSLEKRGMNREEFSAMSSSYMYLANVNASYVSPQSFDNQPLPAYLYSEAHCQSADNCTLANGQPAQTWFNFYPEDECQGEATSQFNPYETVGQCTNFYNVTYGMDGCIDAHTSFTAQYSDAACTQMTHISGWRTHCGPASRNSVVCNATPIPFPTFAPGPSSPAAPESAASSLKGSLLFLLSAIFMLIA
jgi:hypothetical protein